MNEYFEWGEEKNKQNIQKHNVSFTTAKKGFYDARRIIVEDLKHNKQENRYFCIGKINRGIITVRFTYRNNKIRIFGAGFWRQGKKLYEKHNKIHK